MLLPSLIQVNEKNCVITETGHSMSRRHSNDECENIINERVKCLKSVVLLIQRTKRSFFSTRVTYLVHERSPG